MALCPGRSHFRIEGIHRLAQGHESRAGRILVIKGFSLRVMSVRPVPTCRPTLVSLPDVSAIDDIRVLGQTEVSIQVDWKNPPAQVDYFRLTHTDPAGEEEEQNVQMSQEARTKHTIVGKRCNRQNTSLY